MGSAVSDIPPLPPGFQLDGAQQMGSVPPLPPGFKLDSTPQVSDDMSIMERMLAQYGRGVAELGQGVKQLGLHAGGALGLADPSTVAGYDKQVADEAQLYKKDLGERGGGSILPMIGQLVTTAPIGAVGGVAAKGVPFAKSLMQTMGLGAATGAAQPVTEGDFAGTKAAQVGLGAGLGGAASVLGKAVGLGVDAARNPTASVMNPLLKRANKSDFAKESEALAEETGVALTPAQVSGSPSANMAENLARQSIFSRDIAAAGDKARTQQLQDYFDRILHGVRASDASPEIAGKQVQVAAQNMVGNLKKWRDQTAAEDFGKIRAMTKGQAAIQPENTSTLLQQIAEENSGIGTPGGDALANFAKKQLANVDPELTKTAQELAGKIGDYPVSKQLLDAAKATSPAQGNLDKIMALRSYLSKVAGGQAKISGENQDRRIAAQLLQSIDADIEKAGDTIGGDLGGALKQANARYREVSQQIDSVHSSPLGSILGEDVAGAFQSGSFNTVAPEKVIQKLSALKPSELGVVRGLMEKDQPEAWQAFKRSYLESALEKSQQMPASAGANTAVLRPSVLVKTLGEAKKLEAVFSPSEVAQLNKLTGVARRLADTTGYNFPGTAPAEEALGVMNNVLGGGLKAATKVASTALGSRQLARIMTDSNGKAALLQLQKLPPQSAQARQLMAWLAANYGADQPE